ncbi:triose-phosphate isomerase [Candidatus Woesearchaeota archaeon]|nr:triose-phosphate isomerase [Candidatus Woesearchaeota archaeon]
MRYPILVANWKMNKTAAETDSFISQLKKSVKKPQATVVICPPFTALQAAHAGLKGTPFFLGAQDVYVLPKGPFTGEISIPMLRELGVKFVIAGHSERRKSFKESDNDINLKVKAACEHGLKPILCIGESWDDRKEGKTNEVVEKQLSAGIESLDEREARKILIAYEPVWAIGTGNNAQPGQAQDVHATIRKALEGAFSKETAKGIPLLYGGSVNPSNIGSYLKEKDIDGALVGGASLDPGEFASVIQNSRMKADARQ